MNKEENKEDKLIKTIFDASIMNEEDIDLDKWDSSSYKVMIWDPKKQKWIKKKFN